MVHVKDLSHEPTVNRTCFDSPSHTHTLIPFRIISICQRLPNVAQLKATQTVMATDCDIDLPQVFQCFCCNNTQTGGRKKKQDDLNRMIKQTMNLLKQAHR